MKRFIKNCRGQISIFFATTIIVIITFLAFVINIGIFVKAKMNLQNAVDAAAFAGAAVQARQLSNIAYLNWEMRNVYKEWMFKYYVLGNLNINDVANSAGANTSFKMNTYATASSPAEDQYNFPSVCIDFAGNDSTALCRNYIIPGLPRFSPLEISGMGETTNSIMDTLTDQKARDCTTRSELNYATTAMWAYSVKSNEQNALQTQAPEIASNRPGAFPTAFELAIRMRNLEAQVNIAPNTEGVCMDGGNDFNSDYCSKSIADVLGAQKTAANERINKAFFSGQRNLGSEGDYEMRHSFTLKEIPPQPFIDTEAYSLSNLLIPGSSTAKNKYYLDLKLMTLNLATFYTLFTTTKGDVEVEGVYAETEAQCAATKTGLPIPGYPLGFVKNPDVLTYYAVEGKANFIGLFNPFDVDQSGITLSAYAAAKPFGGRVGPMAFDVMRNKTSLVSKQDAGNSKYISSGFITGLDSNFFVDQYGGSVDPGKYKPGAPLPIDLAGGTGFWQKDPSAAVGGWLSKGQVVFSIPNLIYDYPDGPSSSLTDYLAAGPIQVIKPSAGETLTNGLYNGPMFDKFANLLDGRGAGVTPTAIINALHKVRAPTLWEANNYLIPTPETVNEQLGVDSFGIIPKNNIQTSVNLGGGHDLYSYKIYAPLFSDDPVTLYDSPTQISSVLTTYLEAQEQAIRKYLQSMNTAAASIYRENKSGATEKNLGKASAKMVSDIADIHLEPSGNPTDPNALPTCSSMAGKFIYFYYGPDAQSKYGLMSSTAGCNVTPADSRDSYLSGMLEKYFADNASSLREYYQTTFTLPKSPDMMAKLFTAYRPGPQNDSPSNNGVVQNVLNSTTENMLRNFYSTKFITLKSILGSGDNFYSEVAHSFPIHSEGNSAKNTALSTKQTNFSNPLKVDEINLDLGDLNH